MERYCERGLLGKLTSGTSHGMQHLKFAVLMLALVCFIFAAANPQTAGKMEKVKRKGVDIMLCLDVSNSMLATDIQPNRLDACKMAINRFVDKLTGDRVGLVVFAAREIKSLISTLTSRVSISQRLISILRLFSDTVRLSEPERSLLLRIRRRTVS